MRIEYIFQLDFAFLETFSTRTETKWGSLFLNENQPAFYDANHAHISEPCDNPQEVMENVIAFYQSKNITPRFYLYNLGLIENLVSTLKDHQFGYEELTTPVQLWDKKILNKQINDNILFEIVDERNYSEALAIECSIQEFGGKEVREKAFEHEFNHPNFIHYLLRYDGIACASACLFVSDKQARLETVATLEAYRGRGLIGDLIHSIQKEAAKMDLENLWVFPINEEIEKVYMKYGFHTVEKLMMGHAFLGGKSIGEIRG